MIRFSSTLIVISCCGLPGVLAQNASSSLKFSIVFTDRVQLAFTPVGSAATVSAASAAAKEMQNNFRLGDKNFFEGRYQEAARNYNAALVYFNKSSTTPKQLLKQGGTFDVMKLRHSLSAI